MSDLTRWNRAGQTRFNYVDGNAPLFMERLRAAMIAKFLRGIDPDDAERDPEFWYRLFQDGSDLGLDPARKAELDEALDWRDLFSGIASSAETKARRNNRLVENYGTRSEDYAQEIIRAFARASHILAGYTDAYLNEGYLATATQWSSVQKLAAMVNYSPVPAASASTTVALVLATDSGTTEIAPGLAMSAPAPDGGAPLIFETLDTVTGHPDLNALRERRWHVNRETVNLSEGYTTFLLEGGDPPAPGAPVVVAPSKMTAPAARASIISRTRPGDDKIGLQLEAPVTGNWQKGYVDLWIEPDQTLTGRAVSSQARTIVSAANLSPRPGTIVEVTGSGKDVFAIVESAENGVLSLSSSDDLSGMTGLRPLSEVDISEGYFETGVGVDIGYFNVGDQIFLQDIDTTKTFGAADTSRVTGLRKAQTDGTGSTIAHRFAAPDGAVLGAIQSSGDFTQVDVIGAPPRVAPNLQDPNVIVAFDGKPPKDLKEGSYFAARGTSEAISALRVRGVRVEDGLYFVAFDKAPPAPPEETTFFGPMTRRLRIEDHNRSTAPAMNADGWVTLAGLSDSAKPLLRTGNRVIIEDERETGASPVLATVDEVAISSDKTGFEKGERDQAKVRFAADASELSAFIAGWTVFRFNTTRVGHGESKGGKTLGSGNGEKRRQSFALDVKGISFIPDSLSATGVRPDIEVRVDDVAYLYADLTDPTAEDTQSYSVRTKEDGTLDILFRRRIPSGRNSVRVTRYRVGSGIKGNHAVPGTFTKPKSKHPIVKQVRQPFPTSGGADREPADSVRETAGASIAANGRAVSLADFTRLTRRHASVWDALAQRRLRSGRKEAVDVTVLPAGGGALTDDLTTTLATYIRDRALPGVQITVSSYELVAFKVVGTLRYDPLQFNEDDLIAAASQQLLSTFGLPARRLGSPLFVAEPLAVLERVPGADKVQLNVLLPDETPLSPNQIFRSERGNIRALYPNGRQVACIASPTAITLRAEPLS